MGRKKIPPPPQLFQLGDRVVITNKNWQDVTGVINYIMLTGTGSYQQWDYFISTHKRFYYRHPGEKSRLSIRCAEPCLSLLKRKK